VTVKATIGHALCWLCIVDIVHLFTYGLVASDWEMVHKEYEPFTSVCTGLPCMDS